jgi:UPF0716 protein FxsA
MARLIPLLIISIPILEILVFINLSSSIGFFSIIFLIALTAFAGIILLRIQGLSVIGKAQESLEHNKLPIHEIFDGLCIILAGILLITPGFITDTIGILVFLPFIRQLLKALGARIIKTRSQMSVSKDDFCENINKDIIDGEFRDVTETCKLQIHTIDHINSNKYK